MIKSEKKLIVEEKKLKEIGKAKDLVQEISQITTGLFYMSETDAEILPFIGKKEVELNKEKLLLQINKPPDSEITEQNFDDFFRPLIENQNWFGEEEKKIAVQFIQLKKLLRENLIQKKVFRVGKIEIDIYVVGLDAKNILCGIQTKAIET